MYNMSRKVSLPKSGNAEKESEFYTGEPVEPCDLWFRDEFIDLIWETLQRRHVLIAAAAPDGKDECNESPRRASAPRLFDDFSECPVAETSRRAVSNDPRKLLREPSNGG